MDCQDAQECILELLVGPFDREQGLALEGHLASCKACQSFAETQRQLDERLGEAFPQIRVNPEFRRALRARIRQDPASSWPDFMPDVAHLTGCVVTTIVLMLVLPQHSGTVVWAGAAFTGLTYFLQSVLRSSLDTTD